MTPRSKILTIDSIVNSKLPVHRAKNKRAILIPIAIHAEQTNNWLMRFFKYYILY